MAKNKATDIEEMVIEEMVEEAPVEEAPIEEAPAEKSEPEKVKVLIPYVPGEDPEQVVGLNGKLYKIRKGETVEVPVGVAKILENSGKQNMLARKFKEANKNKRTDL